MATVLKSLNGVNITFIPKLEKDNMRMENAFQDTNTEQWNGETRNRLKFMVFDI